MRSFVLWGMRLAVKNIEQDLITKIYDKFRDVILCSWDTCNKSTYLFPQLDLFHGISFEMQRTLSHLKQQVSSSSDKLVGQFIRINCPNVNWQITWSWIYRNACSIINYYFVVTSLEIKNIFILIHNKGKKAFINTCPPPMWKG